MNTYEVVRSFLDQDTRKEEVLHFDADSFEFLASEYTVLLVFRDELNYMIAAVDGFDYVHKIEPEDEGEEKHWDIPVIQGLNPVAQYQKPTTMAA